MFELGVINTIFWCMGLVCLPLVIIMALKGKNLLITIAGVLSAVALLVNLSLAVDHRWMAFLDEYVTDWTRIHDYVFYGAVLLDLASAICLMCVRKTKFNKRIFKTFAIANLLLTIACNLYNLYTAGVNYHLINTFAQQTVTLLGYIANFALYLKLTAMAVCCVILMFAKTEEEKLQQVKEEIEDIVDTCKEVLQQQKEREQLIEAVSNDAELNVLLDEIEQVLAATDTEQVIEEQIVEEQVVEEQPVVEEIVEEQVVEEQPVVEEIVEETVVEEQPVVEEIAEETIVEEQPVVEQVIEETIVEEQQPVIEEVLEETAIEEQIVEEQVVEEQVVEEQPVVEQVIEETVVEEQQPVVEEVIEEEQVVEEQVVEETVVEEIVEETVVEEQPVVEQVIEETVVEEQPVVEQVIEETVVEEQPVVEQVIEEEQVVEIIQEIVNDQPTDEEQQQNSQDKALQEELEQQKFVHDILDMPLEEEPAKPAPKQEQPIASIAPTPTNLNHDFQPKKLSRSKRKIQHIKKFVTTINESKAENQIPNMFCRNCGTRTHSESKICPRCFSRMSPLYKCPRCSTLNETRICTNCGTKMPRRR